MSKKDIEILERYSRAIFGCKYDDLSDKEERMLIAYVTENCSEFRRHGGLYEG